MRRAAAGFTLIEVLLATVLLAAGLALAFATLRSATAMTQRGEQLAQRNEHLRAVQGFLRKRIGAAQRIVFEQPDDGSAPLRFVGEPQRMRFVADVPDYLGRGGPYLHDIGVDDGGERLRVGLVMVQGGQQLQEDPPRPPELLSEDLREVRFRYLGLGQDGALADWSDRWEQSASLPLQVEVSITRVKGPAWPLLVVALAQGDGGGRGDSGAGAGPDAESRE